MCGFFLYPCAHIDRTPPNCVFEVDDFESEWTHRRPFDYIHARELGGCISDEAKLFGQAFRHLAPGGYFELQATRPGRFLSDDGSDELAADAQLWMTTICEGAGRFGKPLDNAHEWADKLRSAGFVDVKEEIRKVGSPPFLFTACSVVFSTLTAGLKSDTAIIS